MDREVLSWNIQSRDGMQTEEPKRKPYDALEKEEGGSICLRALNALLEAANICIYIYTRRPCTVWLPQELSYKTCVRLILQAGRRRKEAPTGILGEITRPTFRPLSRQVR